MSVRDMTYEEMAAWDFPDGLPARIRVGDAGTRRLEVLLNGEPVQGCVAADAIAGFVVRLNREKTGEHGHLYYEKLIGTVTFRVKERS